MLSLVVKKAKDKENLQSYHSIPGSYSFNIHIFLYISSYMHHQSTRTWVYNVKDKKPKLQNKIKCYCSVNTAAKKILC